MLLKVIHREVELLRKHKRFMWSMLLLPIVSFMFLIALFGRGELHDMALAVVDLDKSSISRRFTRMIDATAGIRVEYQAQSVTQAEELMLSGEVGAIVVIPQNMQNDIYSSQVTEPKILINSSRILNASLLYRDISTVAQMLSTGIEMQMLGSAGVPPSKARELALPIYYEKHILFNPYTSYPYYLVSPFNMVMTLIFVTLSASYTLGIERRERLSEKLLKRAGGNAYIALLGKLLPYTLYFSLWLIVCNLYMFGAMQYPFNGSIVMLTLLTVLTVVSYQALSITILVVIRNLTEAMSISAAVATMSFTMGGLTFPQMAMERPIYYIAQAFPYTHYLNGFIDTMRGAEWHQSLQYIAILLIYVVIGIAITPATINFICGTESDKLGIE